MKEYDINSITKDDVKEMIANGDDSHDNQIRVTKTGKVYLSEDIVAAENIDGLAFRFDSFDAGNDYVGQAASEDKEMIERIYRALKANWPKPRHTYIDDWNSNGAYR